MLKEFVKWSIRLDELKNSFRKRVKSFISLCNEESFSCLIYCGFRSFEEQAILYRNGRSLRSILAGVDRLLIEFRRADLANILEQAPPQFGKTVVTNALPGQSLHNYGFAIDAVPTVSGKPVWGTDQESMKYWNKFGGFVKEAGLDWGGSWRTFKDYPHIQMPGKDWHTLIRGNKWKKVKKSFRR